MRTLLLVPTIGLFAALFGTPPAASQEEAGWVDLLGRDLRDWTRMGTGKNPWRLTTDRTLGCAAAHDAYVPDDEFGDGTLRFEYRFRPTADKTGYRASVSVRRTLSATGCKVDLGDDCGRLVGSFQGSSDKVKEIESRPAVPVARRIGEWNQVEVRMEGSSVLVTINGKPAASFDRCEVTHGLVFFEVEGSEIEFRKVHWREAR